MFDARVVRCLFGSHRPIRDSVISGVRCSSVAVTKGDAEPTDDISVSSETRYTTASAGDVDSEPANGVLALSSRDDGTPKLMYGRGSRLLLYLQRWYRNRCVGIGIPIPQRKRGRVWAFCVEDVVGASRDRDSHTQ
jgi:hypothetical protein